MSKKCDSCDPNRCAGCVACDPKDCAVCGIQPEYTYEHHSLATGGNNFGSAYKVIVSCPICHKTATGPSSNCERRADYDATAKWNKKQKRGRGGGWIGSRSW